MLLRCCMDLISKQISWQRPLLAARLQLPCYSTDNSLPLKPKRSKNPWVFYYMENCSQARVENPGVSSPKIFSLLSARWHSLGKEAQQKYLKLAEDDKTRYEKEIHAYKASLTPEAEEAIAKEKERIKTRKVKLIEKKKLMALGIPKRPPNGYVLFSADYIRKKQALQGKKVPLLQQVPEAAGAWSKLSASEKAKWDDIAATKLKEFKKKFAEWEQEMSSKGYLEINEKKKP